MEKFFSDREIRALALFLPLAILVILAIVFMRPRTTPEIARQITKELENRNDSISLHPFDPNTADFDELRLLGFSKHQAVSLLKYRAAGKIFRIPEDLTLCYGIDDSLYHTLRPYIRIGRRYAIAPQKYRRERVITEPLAPSPFRIDTVSARYLRAIGAPSVGGI